MPASSPAASTTWVMPEMVSGPRCPVHTGPGWRPRTSSQAETACDEDGYSILNESLSGSAHGSVGSVGSGDNDEVARSRAVPFMLVSGSSVPGFLR